MEAESVCSKEMTVDDRKTSEEARHFLKFSPNSHFYSADPAIDTTEQNQDSDVLDQSDSKLYDDEDEEEYEEDSENEDQNASGLTAQQRARHAITGRGVTLAMLMDDGIIQPGENVLSIDYLGQKFTADLLNDGSIRGREEDKVFNSPSAWALHCKKIVNPSKKSGCGWASVRYKGKKLDAYKSSWVRKQSILKMTSGEGLMKEEQDTENEDFDAKIHKIETEEDSSDFEADPPALPKIQPQVTAKSSVKHYTLGKATQHHDPTTLVECHTFAQLCKLQPFNVKVSTNCLLLMDYHAHLCNSEILGYLAGKWDPTTQCVEVQEAFPLKLRIGDQENAQQMEILVKNKMYSSGLTLVGWYHSHPNCQPDPSLHDIEAQMSYQLQLKGMEYHPCLSFIISPYNYSIGQKESQTRAYWVMPPPEQRPLDYGIPMALEYEIKQDSIITSGMEEEMKSLRKYFADEQDSVNLRSMWSPNVTFLDKIKGSLHRHMPSDLPVHEFYELIVRCLLSPDEKKPSKC